MGLLQRSNLGILFADSLALGRTLAQTKFGLGRVGALASKPIGGGVARWLFTTNHKEIGILYIIFGTFAGLFGSILS